MKKIQLFVFIVWLCSFLLNAQSKVYWVDGDAGKVQRANTDGSSVQDLVTGLSMPCGITIDDTNGKIYWGKGSSPATIRRANLDGSGVQDLVTGLGIVNDIALDVAGGKMYWTDSASGYNRIQRADLNGNNVQTLVSGRSNPAGISLDVANGKMYWAEFADTAYDPSAVPKVCRANLDGSSVEILLSTSAGLLSPYGLELDLKNSKIYFSDFDTGKIQRANLDGTGLTDVLTGVGYYVDAIALDVDNQIIFYATFDTTLKKVNFDGTGNATIVSGLTKSLGVAFSLPAFTISGNAGVAGATLSYVDGTAKTATADGSGNYSFTISYNWSGTVTPSLTGYTFTPASRTYANVLANQTSQDYTATAITYTISGNAGIAGATLSYTDGTPKTATADGSGNYSFTVSYNWSGTVTPSRTGYVFSPANRTYANVLANQTSQDYSTAAITYTISGNAGIAGATMSYSDGTPKTATADGSGNYSFAVSFNWSGTVTPSYSGYGFSPASRTYTNVQASQTSQDYTATPITYTISGNAGIAGATLSYIDGAPKTATADGSGNYSFTVSFNWSGTVTPSYSGYGFTPANRTYANVLANQTSQDYTATPITYTISGNAGIAGATLSYTDGTPKTATADGSGNYSFTVSFNWSGTVTPSLIGYTFTPASRTYTNVLANQTAQNYTATAITYAISGNAGIAGATLSYIDGAPKTATSDGSGNYSFTVSYNWSGTATPSLTGYTFTPASRTYANVLANQTSQDYTATPITYTISGNAGIAGAALSYTDGTPKTATADGSGNYSFTVSYSWSGTVTPSRTGYTFTPSNRTYTNVLANQTSQDYTATPITYAISGNAGIAGATLSYSDGTPKTAAADGSGNYSFTVSYNWSGTVTPSRTGYTFTPSNRAYTNVLANQTGQDYTAVAITYTISGNAGIAGATLSYTDGTPKTATADGSNNYSFTVSYNWSGTVTPSLTGYTFTPASRTYTHVLVNQTAQNYTATLVAFNVNFITDGTRGSWLTGNTRQTVLPGGDCSPVGANAPVGYVFRNWTGSDGFTSTSANPLTITNVRQSMRITARFAENAPPTVRIVRPQEGDKVSGIVTIEADVHDDKAIAGCSILVDDQPVSDGESAPGAADQDGPVLDLGDLCFTVDDGIALALDHGRNLLLLTHSRQWRRLAGAEARILDLQSGIDGCLYVQCRQLDGSDQWLKIAPGALKAEIMPKAYNGPMAQWNAAARATTLQTLLAVPGAGGRIIAFKETTLRIEWQDVQGGIQSWPLPVSSIRRAHLAGGWLAIEGPGSNGWLLCLLNHADGSMRTFELGTAAPADWGLLLNGSLLIAGGAQSDLPGAWGIFRRTMPGWLYEEGRAVDGGLAALAPLNLDIQAENRRERSEALDLQEATESYSAAWDTRGLASGSHIIRALAVDSDGLNGEDQVEVFIQNILLGLEIQRHSESLWMIRHDYADIAISISNPGGALYDKLILERSQGGSWSTVIEIAAADMSAGIHSYQDAHLDSGKSYTYRVRALNALGVAVASSVEITI